jgi:hypothetical protein
MKIEHGLQLIGSRWRRLNVEKGVGEPLESSPLPIPRASEDTSQTTSQKDTSNQAQNGREIGILPPSLSRTEQAGTTGAGLSLGNFEVENFNREPSPLVSTEEQHPCSTNDTFTSQYSLASHKARQHRKFTLCGGLICK